MEEQDERLNYPRFTKDMIPTHTILIPSMLQFHFKMMRNVLVGCGYKAEILSNMGPEVVLEGLKYVHNDTCYPALLVIGQFIDALNHRDDLDKVVLLITQTGGGCRASNYIHLLRKALVKAGYGYIPVVSLNLSNLEKDSGLQIKPLINKLAAAMTYGDMIMYLYNKTRSYEVEKGSALNLANWWVDNLSNQINNKKGMSQGQIKKNCKFIAIDFDNLKLDLKQSKPKFGIVGEIYIKYAALGNNGLEEFLVNEGAEVMVPGLFGFIMYSLQNSIYDQEIYGHHKKGAFFSKVLLFLLHNREKAMIKAIQKTKFTPMNYFKDTKELSEGVISHGTKMGEGWLLTAEMMELVEIGYSNIVCAQPFGCLPNHICGKGVMKRIKQLKPDANIVAIDYDPSATKVNQENRIKLTLAIAKERIVKDEPVKL